MEYTEYSLICTVRKWHSLFQYSNYHLCFSLFYCCCGVYLSNVILYTCAIV